jgi:carbamoylphosphate synthase large subunit
MNKRLAIVCLAAGKSQMIVIRKAQELGFAVIAVDRNPQAIGFDLADERIVASTYEARPILEHLEKLSARYTLKAVVNRSAGPPVITAAELSEQLGLPGISPNVARLVIDKGLLMERCRRADLPVPFGRTISEVDNINEPDFYFPCVIKPALSLLGKSGVRVVSSYADLSESILEARYASFAGKVVVESFVPGYNVSLIGFVQSGKLVPLVLVDELNGADVASRVHGAGMAVPSRFQGRIEERFIIDTAKTIVKYLELDTTVCCMSFRCDFGGSPTLIEIHLDMGGDLILDHLLPASTSFDFLAHFIEGLVGKYISVPMINVSPVAILYDKGEGLLSERSFQLLQAAP